MDTENPFEIMKKTNHCAKCVLCGTGNDPFVSYFSFPTNPIQRRLWAAFCKMKVEDIYPHLRLCNKHFREENFVQKVKKKGGRLRLRSGAIPSIFVAFTSTNPLNRTRDDRIKFKSKTKCSFPSCNWKYDRPFFKFPGDIAIKIKWAEYCGIDAENIKPRTYLCILHFDDDAILYDHRHIGGRIQLKPTAIPTVIFVSESALNEDCDISNETETEESEIVNNIEEKMVTNDTSNCESQLDVINLPVVDTFIPETASDNVSNTLTEEFVNSNMISEVEIEESADAYDVEEVFDDTTDLESQPYVMDSSSLDTTLTGIGCTFKKRKSLIGDFCASDLKCESTANKYVSLVKKVVRKKNRTIATLRQKISRLERTVKSAKDFIRLMKSKNRTSEETISVLTGLTGPTEDKSLVQKEKGHVEQAAQICR